ncbi:unnamed protein product, partial [Ectocarpus sp. 12 AP-2014]
LALPPASCEPSHIAPPDSYTTSALSSLIPLGAHRSLTCDAGGGVVYPSRELRKADGHSPKKPPPPRSSPPCEPRRYFRP